MKEHVWWKKGVIQFELYETNYRADDRDDCLD